jgi:hypothetical protein
MNEKLLLETTPPGLNVVNFNDDRDNLLPFHSLKYVFDNYIQDYDWFFFITDNSFVRIAKVCPYLSLSLFFFFNSKLSLISLCFASSWTWSTT